MVDVKQESLSSCTEESHNDRGLFDICSEARSWTECLEKPVACIVSEVVMMYLVECPLGEWQNSLSLFYKAS